MAPERSTLHPEWCTRRAEEIARDLPANLERELERIRRSYTVSHNPVDVCYKEMVWRGVRP